MHNSKELYHWQCFIDKNIPIVAHMGLVFKQIGEQELIAHAPLDANINDKGTVFGGSSAALMKVCGWSLIKFNLEQQGIDNDVVVCSSEVRWLRPQYDDLQIKVSSKIAWQQIVQTIKQKDKIDKQAVSCKILDGNGKICTKMTAKYVILPSA